MKQLAVVQKFENARFGDMHGYIENGTAFLNVEESAYGFGFTTFDKNGVETVAWDLLNRILKKFGYKKKVKAGDYIPENIFYRLAMKSDNESAEKFQAWIADEVIPTLRKTGTYTVGNEIEERKEMRERQIKARKNATSIYEMYVVYAKRQGDTREAGKIYAKFSKLVNSIAGIPDGCRPLSTKKELKILEMAEKIIAETLKCGIAQNLYYKDIEEDVMSKGAEILQLVSSSSRLLR